MLNFGVAACSAVLPGIGPEDLLSWAKGETAVCPEAKPAYPGRLPMMTARRLSPGARAAVECALDLLDSGAEPEFLVFASRHAELPRSEKLLRMLASGSEETPTDFTMSVHNAAAGSLTIARRLNTPASSVAAGPNTFASGLAEAVCAFADGARSVLLTCFENRAPELLSETFAPADLPPHPWAASFLIVPGDEFSHPFRDETPAPGELPAALAFLKALILKRAGGTAA